MKLGLPIALYVGVAYTSYEHRPLVGLNVSLSRGISSHVIFDGAPIHPLLAYSWARSHFLCAGLFK